MARNLMKKRAAAEMVEMKIKTVFDDENNNSNDNEWDFFSGYHCGPIGERNNNINKNKNSNTLSFINNNKNNSDKNKIKSKKINDKRERKRAAADMVETKNNENKPWDFSEFRSGPRKKVKRNSNVRNNNSNANNNVGKKSKGDNDSKKYEADSNKNQKEASTKAGIDASDKRGPSILMTDSSSDSSDITTNGNDNEWDFLSGYHCGPLGERNDNINNNTLSFINKNKNNSDKNKIKSKKVNDKRERKRAAADMVETKNNENKPWDFSEFRSGPRKKVKRNSNVRNNNNNDNNNVGKKSKGDNHSKNYEADSNKNQKEASTKAGINASDKRGPSILMTDSSSDSSDITTSSFFSVGNYSFFGDGKKDDEYNGSPFELTTEEQLQRIEHQQRRAERQVHSNRPMKLSTRMAYKIAMLPYDEPRYSPVRARRLFRSWNDRYE